MREGFDKYQNGEPKAVALYEAAFGTKADASKVSGVIKSLETGTATAQVATEPFTGGQIAAVDWSKADKKSPWTPSDIKFGSTFHGLSTWLFQRIDSSYLKRVF